MSTSCCVKDCDELATIRQPLRLGGELVLHVPLCREHSVVWEGFVGRLHAARDRLTREQRDADWLLDAALAMAVLPPNDPL
jgi:hypothetical protein